MMRISFCQINTVIGCSASCWQQSIKIGDFANGDHGFGDAEHILALILVERER